MVEPVVVHTVPRDLRAELRETLDGRVAVRVADTPEESRALLADAEAAVSSRFPDELLDAADGLRWLQAMSSGVDYLPLDDLAAAGVALTNAAGVHGEPIGEQVFGYLLAFERRLLDAWRNQHRGVWERETGGELAGKTLGIVGLGAIGGRVAELGQAFGMDVVGTKRDPDAAPDAVDAVHPPEELRDVLLAADYLVLACPLTDETEGLIGPQELAALGRDGVLVNIARGEVVDQAALVRALQNHAIGGAALDVFAEEPLSTDSPLWDLSNVLLTPHTAGHTPRYAERLAEVVATNVAAYEADGVDGLANRVL